MNNVNRFEILLQILGVSTLWLLIFSFYYMGIYLALYDSLVDISTLLDIAKWQHLGRV